MHRAAICLGVLACFGIPPLHAQEQQEQEEQQRPAYVYEAYHRIAFGDLEEWNRQYREYSTPILEDLREEGIIQGWTQWQHNTGSEYNVLFSFRTYDWASLNRFWSEYLTRLREAVPESEWQAALGMSLEHRDEIWNIGDVHVPAGMRPSHIYASTFQVSFADMPEWNRMWSEVAAPILQESMDEGLLLGWVKLNHNTGGPHSSKVLYFFDSWDDIDDLFSKLLGTLSREHPQEWERTNRLFQAHDDVIWVPTARESS